jgi:hypothetical protein
MNLKSNLSLREIDTRHKIHNKISTHIFLRQFPTWCILNEMSYREKQFSYLQAYCCPGSIPGSARFFYSPQRPDRLWGPTTLLSNGYREIFPRGVKRQERETDHSLPSCAEVKNGGAVSPLPHMSSLYSAWLSTGTDRDGFTFSYRGTAVSHMKMSHRSTTFIPPLSCYTSNPTLLPHIPFQSSTTLFTSMFAVITIW